MNRTTPDSQTPIFHELNAELGELPEIDVHDFDWHGFQFGSRDDSPAEPGTAAPKRGGRRRRKD